MFLGITTRHIGLATVYAWCGFACTIALVLYRGLDNLSIAWVGLMTLPAAFGYGMTFVLFNTLSSAVREYRL